DAEHAHDHRGNQARLAQALPFGRLPAIAHQAPGNQQQQAAAHGAVQKPTIKGCPESAHDISPAARLLRRPVFPDGPRWRALTIIACIRSSSSAEIRSDWSKLRTS